MDRRRLLASLATAALVPGMFAVRAREPGTRGSLVVLVRQADGVVAVNPHTGAVVTADLRLATPSARAIPALSSTPSLLTDTDSRYWMVSPDGDAGVWQRVGDGAWWWLRDGQHPCRLDLPADLEPALPSGAVARWFHGATVDAAHLGTGTLRLIAVDIETGEIVLDRSFDRRLELAATAVSDDGDVVAHVQGGNTMIDIWAVDLTRDREMETSVPIQPAAPVAPGAIDLEVARDTSGAVVAAGLRWEWPGHPDPRVLVVGETAAGDSRVTEVPGELLGIQPLVEQ